MSKDKKYLKPIFFKKNCGQSAALSAGFKYCSGDIVVSMDGDLQTDPKDISLLIPYLKKYDMVNGMRATRQDGIYRKLVSLIGNSFRNFITKDNIRDTGCPLKVFKKENIYEVKVDDSIDDVQAAKSAEEEIIRIAHLPD